MTRKAPTKRITKAEKTLRVARVKELIIKGMTRREIIAYIAAKTDWKVASRTVDDYIAEAYAEFKLASEVDKEQERKIAEGRFQMLFEMATKVQDVKAATAAEWKRCELLGLPLPAEKAPQKIIVEHVQSKVEALIERVGSEDKVAELLNNLLNEIPPDYVQ